MGMFEDFMTMDVLTTFAGITGAVIVIVQFTKSLIKKKFGDHFVRLYSFIIALILSFLFNKQGANIEGIVLTIINAMMITIASMGGYELIADPMAQSVRKK
jgi:RsiW-degrading membrane proteinase PrsW (M82 family)